MPRKSGMNGENVAGIGHNGATDLPDKGKAFVERIETLNRDLASEKGEYMQRCKTVREDITAVLSEAADAGITRKTIKTAVKVRALERKAAEARDSLKDLADQDMLDRIRLALGDLSDLPLGKAALGEGEAVPA
jgi:uncharacterized protein (UPF0335 family)